MSGDEFFLSTFYYIWFVYFQLNEVIDGMGVMYVLIMLFSIDKKYFLLCIWDSVNFAVVVAVTTACVSVSLIVKINRIKNNK